MARSSSCASTETATCRSGSSSMLATAALGGHGRTRDVVLWLCGCLLLGLGVLAKTAPLVLAAVLCRVRGSSRPSRGCSAPLFSSGRPCWACVIAALVPIAVWDHVIGYRSTRGFFGLAGMVSVLGSRCADSRDADRARVALSHRLLVATMVATGTTGAESGVPPRRRRRRGRRAVGPEAFDRLTSLDVRVRYDTAFSLAVLVRALARIPALARTSRSRPRRLFLLVADRSS